jgi:hypothetical protein
MSVLHAAHALIHGDREKDYGHPSVNFQAIADLWDDYLTAKAAKNNGDVGTITSQDVCNMMILLKICRDLQGYKDDTVIDIAGYAGLKERLHSGT